MKLKERLFHPSVKFEYGVRFLSEPDDLNAFERVYTDLRKKEGRLLEDEKVKKLPDFEAGPLYNEWAIRKNSANRLRKYIRNKNSAPTLLEIGCGNGWLSAFLAKIPNCEVVGIDINLQELEQAARVFYEENTNFHIAWCDVFDPNGLPPQSFDFIVLAASIQYFQDLPKLIQRLRELLKPNGEIHVVDSPFYESEAEAEQARVRSENYFDRNESHEMTRFYHHHNWPEVKKLGGKWVDNPRPILKRAFRWWFQPFHSPFGWVKF